MVHDAWRAAILIDLILSISIEILFSGKYSRNLQWCEMDERTPL